MTLIGTCREIRRESAQTTVRVACSRGGAAGMPLAKTTSGVSATNSAACLRKLSGSPPPQRRSIRTLRPTAQPASCDPCRNAARRACRLIHEHPDTAHALGLLRARRQRPRCCGASKQREELAPFQLIELHSAPASAALHDSELGGISQPLG